MDLRAECQMMLKDVGGGLFAEAVAPADRLIFNVGT